MLITILKKTFIKKFKVVNSIVPISIALFANSSIVEKKIVDIYLIDQKFGKDTSRGGLPTIFFDDFDFENMQTL